jgi:DNA-binding transcriptional ArsR family regulator
MEDLRDSESDQGRSAFVSLGRSTESDATWEFATIGEVAEELGFTLRALRFYEEKGLVSPRRSGNRRLYSPADRRRLEALVLHYNSRGPAVD